MDLTNLSFLIIGQAKTARTETLEDYLKKQAKFLAVISLSGPYAKTNESRCTLYHNGNKIKEFSLFSFRIKKINRWKYPLITVTFSLYIIAILYAVLRLGKRFDIAIMVATSSTLIGLILLRPLGIVKRVVFYCIDYYPPGVNYLGDFFGFQRLFYLLYKQVDLYSVKQADAVWEISPRIKEGRASYAGLVASSYDTIIAPLGFSEEFCSKCQSNNKSIIERERWTLGFIGVLSPWQGLTLVIDAMPQLCKKFPDIKVRIIGDGPFSTDLKKLVKQKGLEQQFIFHGYIKNEEEVFDMLSRCVIGLATWTGDQTDYSRYADPGKPKLYTLLGLPVVITSVPYISKSIAETGAGEVVEYDIIQFLSAVEKIISSNENLQKYLAGVERFKPYCYSTNIFDRAFLDTFEYWNKKE